MNISSILDIIPPKFKSKVKWVIAGAFFKAILDFIGTAALLSILVLVLGRESLADYIYLIAFIGVFVIIVKNLITIIIENSRNKFLLNLFKYYSVFLFESYYKKGLLYIKEKGSSSLTHHINYICLSFVIQVLSPVFSLISDSILLLLLVIALLIYSPLTVAIILLSFLPFIVGYILFVRNKINSLGKQENEIRRKQFKVIQEIYKGYPEIEINGAFPSMRERFNESLEAVKNIRLRLEVLKRIPTGLTEIGTAIALLILIFITPNNQELIIKLGVFGVAAFRMMPSIRSIIANWINIQNQFYTVDIIKDAVQDEQAAKNTANKDEFSFCSSLELRNLGFSFDNNKDVIREFSLIVNKGEKIGIQGTSGRGKSTLFNLMLGFYPLNDGEILIDGVKLTSKNRGGWHKLIGYVPQDVFILDGSIKDNICLSNSIDLDEDKIWAVLKQVNLYDWASSLPCALDTVLGENGAKLSGGQKQRIAIARALYKGASVLFFDEATSALDSKTEEDILNVLQSLCNNYKDITLFMIAHRDSSLKMCDRIINL